VWDSDYDSPGSDADSESSYSSSASSSSTARRRYRARRKYTSSGSLGQDQTLPTIVATNPLYSHIVSGDDSDMSDEPQTPLLQVRNPEVVRATASRRRPRGRPGPTKSEGCPSKRLTDPDPVAASSANYLSDSERLPKLESCYRRTFLQGHTQAAYSVAAFVFSAASSAIFLACARHSKPSGQTTYRWLTATLGLSWSLCLAGVVAS